MSLRILLGGVAMAALTACSGSDGITFGGTTTTTTGGTTTITCPSGLSAGSGTTCNILGGTLLGTTVLSASNSPYTLDGRLDVGIDGGASGNLEIPAGVTIVADDGSDFVVVNRGSTINATGNASNPVVFTSAADFNGTQTDPDNAFGEWGGIVILGRAPINECAAAVSSSLIAGNAGCQNVIEGVPSPNAIYGGASESDSSGTLSYVQVKYAGFAIEEGNELNGISFGGVGDGTTIEFVQVHNNSDDGIEMFGGTANLEYIVLTGIDDDSLDTDLGWNGYAQYVLALQYDGRGDNLMEMSSAGSGDNPGSAATDPVISNFTLIGASGADYLWDMNSGHEGQFFNGVAVNISESCFRLGETKDGALSKTLPGPAGFGVDDPAFSTVLALCGDDLVQDDAPVDGDPASDGSAPGGDALGGSFVTNGTNFTVQFDDTGMEEGVATGAYTPTLTDAYVGAPFGAFINGGTEDGVTAVTIPDGLDLMPSGIGADPAGTQWYTFACDLTEANPC